MRLLVVEDDAKLARALQRGLQREGYAIDLAGTGDEGLAQVKENDYDVVLLDVMLPGRDGFSVCRAMLVHENCRSTRVRARSAIDCRSPGSSSRILTAVARSREN